MSPGSGKLRRYVLRITHPLPEPSTLPVPLMGLLLLPRPTTARLDANPITDLTFHRDRKDSCLGRGGESVREVVGASGNAFVASAGELYTDTVPIRIRS
jgi:hypothetical protein